MSEVTFHKATTDDVPVLVEYRIRFATELKGEQPMEVVNSLREQMAKYFARATADGTCISFIAKQGNEIAGIGSVTIREQPGNFTNPSGRWGYVMNMYTVPEFRNKGVAKIILKALIEAGRQAGITSFELHATKSGEPLYIKDGFQLHKEPTYRKYI
jgi:GNAT superfamily N-acetyltransferase